MKNIVQEQTEEVIDKFTGEVIKSTTKKTFSISRKTEPFYLTYSKFMSVLYGINSLSAVKILWKFLENAQYNTGIVIISPKMKKEIISDLNISESIYSKSLKLLSNLKIVTGSRGQYNIDKQIFGKGDYKTREKLLAAGCKVDIQPNIEEFENEKSSI